MLLKAKYYIRECTYDDLTIIGVYDLSFQVHAVKSEEFLNGKVLDAWVFRGYFKYFYFYCYLAYVLG